MTRTLSALLGLLLLSAGLAGCLSSSGGEQTGGAAVGEASLEGQTPASSTAGNDTGPEGEPLVFAEASPIQQTVWANDSFTAADSCYASGCPRGTAFQEVELAGQLAENAPTRITAELTYDAGASVFAEPLNLFAYGEDATFYDFQLTEEQGREQIDATVLEGDEPVIVGVFYNWPTGDEPEVDYTLRIDVESSPDVVPAGVPVELAAEPGDALLADPMQAVEGAEAEGPARLLAYGPNDEFLDSFGGQDESLETTLPEDTAAGEHVFVVPEESAPVEISTNGSATEMRALHLAFQRGEGHPVDGVEPVSWSFQLDRRPLALGMVYGNDRPATASVSQGQATLRGPQGTVIEGELGCGFCLTLGYFAATGTPIGADGLAAGGYEAVYEPTAETGSQVSHFLVTYER